MSELLEVSDLRVRYPVAGGMAAMLNKNRRSYVDVVHGVSLMAFLPSIVYMSWSSKNSMLLGVFLGMAGALAAARPPVIARGDGQG